MKKIIALVLVVLFVAAVPKQTKTFKFELTPDETQLVFEALGELPAKRVEGLRIKILTEVDKQNKETQKK